MRHSSNSRVPPLLIKDCRAAKTCLQTKIKKTKNLPKSHRKGINKSSLKGIREKTTKKHTKQIQKGSPEGPWGLPKVDFRESKNHLKMSFDAKSQKTRPKEPKKTKILRKV